MTLKIVMGSNIKLYIGGHKGDTGAGGTWAMFQVPTGTKNGSNQSFTLPYAPLVAPMLFWGSTGGDAAMLYGTDYTYSSTTLTLLTFVPEEFDRFYCHILH